MKVLDPDFDPDNIPKKQIRDQEWKTMCPICESLMLAQDGKWKCSCCGNTNIGEQEI
jgi:hypothetical protein